MAPKQCFILATIASLAIASPLYPGLQSPPKQSTLQYELTPVEALQTPPAQDAHYVLPREQLDGQQQDSIVKRPTVAKDRLFPVPVLHTPSIQDTRYILPREELGAQQDDTANGIGGTITGKDGQGCTTLMRYVGPFTFGPTSTTWTATSTCTSLVDCHDCQELQRVPLPHGPGPVVFFNTTVTAATPSVTTVYACSASPSSKSSTSCSTQAQAPAKTSSAASKTSSAASKATAGPSFYPASIETPTTIKLVPNPTCTVKTLLPPHIPDSTLTNYASTSTSYWTFDCGNCAVVWATRTLRLLAPVKYTATVDATVASTKTNLMCKPKATN